MIKTIKKLFVNPHDDLKTQLINRLISIQNQMENIWEYHPGNPERISPEEQWEKLRIEREKVNKAIGTIYEGEEED
jgi:hypothetical protein